MWLKTCQSFFLEDNLDVGGPDGEVPQLVVGAVIILSLIFTLSVFVFMALYNVGK